MKKLFLSIIPCLAISSFATMPEYYECEGEGIKLNYYEDVDGQVGLRLAAGKKNIEIDTTMDISDGIIRSSSPVGTLITAIDQAFSNGETSYVSFVLPHINLTSPQTSLPFMTSFIEHVSKDPSHADGLVDRVTRVVMIKCLALISDASEEVPPSGV